MSPISDDQIARYRYVLLDDDATVLDAVVALRDAGGADWWCLLVNRSEAGYAAGQFSQLANGLKAEGEAYLRQPLGALVGSVLQPVEAVGDQDAVDFDTLLAQAADSSCSVAVVTQGGAVRGVVLAPVTRHLSSPLDAGLVQLAGKYATLPDKGLLGPTDKKDKPSKPKRRTTRRNRRRR